ncbi:glycosyltransferase, partial [Vibrio mimicus]
RRKRIEKSIELICLLKCRGVKSILNIIGPVSDNEYYKELIQKVASLGLANEVNFLGAMNSEEIVEIYKSSDFGVFCSEEETFGLAPMEMLASQLPLITTKVGVFKERYSEFKSLGVVFFEDIKNDEELLSFFIDNNSKKSSEIANYIGSHFSVSDVIRQYENLYSKVIV